MSLYFNTELKKSVNNFFLNFHNLNSIEIIIKFNLF
jgi:hypothetical protein